MIKRTWIFLMSLLILQACHVGRFVVYNFAGLNDYKIFASKEIKKSAEPFRFIESIPGANPIVLPKELTRKNKNNKPYSFQEVLNSSGTVAFIAIRNDSILYQWYNGKYNPSSLFPSFSMAKSYVSALVGIAIGEGKIKSTSEPITNYLDYLDKKKFGKITIQDLLDMRSGIRYNENYFNPFGDVAKYYYGTNLKKYLKHLKIKTAPGKEFEYISVNTQLLGMIVEKATKQSLSDYLQEKLWSQIGTEFDASWSIDSKKHHTEKAFCCINARAKDFARFGRLYLNNGNWQGKQIISQAWIDESVYPKDNKNNFLYSNAWWHSYNYFPAADSSQLKKPYILLNGIDDNSKKPMQYLAQPSGDFFALGHLGQYIYVVPSKKMIFVRIGKEEGWIDWPGLFMAIAARN